MRSIGAAVVAIVDGGGHDVVIRVDDGLFRLALWGLVLVDGRLFDGVGWCMLVSL